MPKAAPSSRVASFMADPAPARRAGTADMIDAVIGDIDSAIPEVRGTTQITTMAYDECGVRRLNIARPVAIDNMPHVTVRCAPKRALRRGVNGATTNMISAMGSRRSAVVRAL